MVLCSGFRFHWKQGALIRCLAIEEGSAMVREGESRERARGRETRESRAPAVLGIKPHPQGWTIQPVLASLSRPFLPSPPPPSLVFGFSGFEVVFALLKGYLRY